MDCVTRGHKITARHVELPLATKHISGSTKAASLLTAVGMVCDDQQHKCRRLKARWRSNWLPRDRYSSIEKAVFVPSSFQAGHLLDKFAAWNIIWKQRPVSCKKLISIFLSNSLLFQHRQERVHDQFFYYNSLYSWIPFLSWTKGSW